MSELLLWVWVHQLLGKKKKYILNKFMRKLRTILGSLYIAVAIVTWKPFHKNDLILRVKLSLSHAARP